MGLMVMLPLFTLKHGRLVPLIAEVKLAPMATLAGKVPVQPNISVTKTECAPAATLVNVLLP